MRTWRSESIEWFIEGQAFLPSCYSAPRQPPSLSPVSKLPLFLSLPLCCRSSLLTGEGVRGWARSKIMRQRRTWPSINHSIFYAAEDSKRSSYIGGDVGEGIAVGMVLQKSEGGGGPSHEGGGERGGWPSHGSGGEGGGWTGVGDEGGQRAQGSTSAPCVRTSSTAYTVKNGWRFSRPQPGCHLPNSPCQGIIQ